MRSQSKSRLKKREHNWIFTTTVPWPHGMLCVAFRLPHTRLPLADDVKSIQYTPLLLADEGQENNGDQSHFVFGLSRVLDVEEKIISQTQT
ncbi:hypothetical protein CEXT_175261 [Caerostris extrusa]|uniref:Uncharacterized protein n=1 Tax=Caerostris extrusa TaxID=172846 RepID=A0AAV4QQM4_CAEEX|nr:hypothetical protein CEXT_175261 [Caerostris extrusa]